MLYRPIGYTYGTIGLIIHINMCIQGRSQDFRKGGPFKYIK